MVCNGYGKILDVDLATRSILRRDIDARFAQDYIGGMGFSSKILYDEVGVDVDPFSPKNVVVFANGPLTGTHAPCAGRTEITTKSPLTDNIGTGNTGGIWGAALKHAGFDVIIVRNQSEKPVYIWVDDNSVEIKAAAHLWGKDTVVTSDILRQELGDKVSVLAIGPAGENLVRFACPLNDYYHVAGRCGAGAVMGAKKLKAIAVRGTGTVKLARPEEFREAAKLARERLRLQSEAAMLPGGPQEARKLRVERGCLPAKNFQTGFLPNWLENKSLATAKKYFTRKEGTCYACPIPCFNLVEVNEGKYAGVQANRGTMPGVVFDWGAKCAIGNLPAIWKCKELCQHLGMDYASAAGSIAFAMELYQRGIITKSDTDGLELGWGNEDATMKLVCQIASREGFGDVLAEGSAKAAVIVGRGAERYVMATKGMEMMSDEPRSGLKGWIIGDLTNPRGGDNVKNTHCHADRYNPNWWVDKFDMFEQVKAEIYRVPPEEIADTWEGKALLCRWFEDLYSIANGLGLCFFPAGFRLALGPTHYAALLSACTGRDITPQGIMEYGEKLFTLLKVYAVRQGFTRQDDTWPDRFFEEPLPEGPAKGAILSRTEIDRLLDEYYQLRGWDKESGIPSREKLVNLGLQDIADELRTLGKLPVTLIP